MTRGVVKCLKCWTHLAQLFLSEIIPFLLFEILIMERLGFFLCVPNSYSLCFFLCKEPRFTGFGETTTGVSTVSTRLSFLSVGLLVDRGRTQDLIDFEFLLFLEDIVSLNVVNCRKLSIIWLNVVDQRCCSRFLLALSVFFEQRTGKQVQNNGDESAVLQFWAYIFERKHNFRACVGNKVNSKMFMLPVNEAKGSKHCFEFVRVFEQILACR